MLALMALAVAAPVQLGVGVNLAAWNEAAVHRPLVAPTARLDVGLGNRPWSVGLQVATGWSEENNANAQMRSVPVWILGTLRTWRQRSGFRVGLQAGPALWTVQTTIDTPDLAYKVRQNQLGFALGPSLDVRLGARVRSVFSMTGIARKSGFDVLCSWQLAVGDL